MIRENRHHRSHYYQYLLNEVKVSYPLLCSIVEEDSIQGRMGAIQKEEILDLQDRIQERMWELMREHLTPSQMRVVEAIIKHGTQEAAAKSLNRTQSTIYKTLFGDRRRDYGNQAHGGIENRMKLVAAKDEVLKSLERQIQELQDEQW
jgi:hypothetical protein